MLVNKYAPKLPTLDLPPSGSKSNNSNLPLGGSLAPTSSVVINVNQALGAQNKTVSWFLANLSSLTAPVNIEDTAANIAKNLSALNTDAALSKIGSGTVSQKGGPSDLVITYEQWTRDADVAATGTSILEKLGANSNPVGSNFVRVSGVVDAHLSDLEAQANVKKIGVIGVAKADVSARIANSKVATIGVIGLGKDDLLSSSSYYSDLQNVKVTSLGLEGVPSTSLSSVLSTPKLGVKVKSVEVTGVLAKDVNAVGSRAQVISMAVSDTSANLAANFNALLKQQNKIDTVTQSTKTVMGLTGSQFRGGASLLAKFDSGDYTANLKNVLASDVGGFASNSKVLDIQVSDTGLNIGRNFAALSDAKITKITQTSLKDSISISADQYASSVATLAKMTGGSYSLAITGYTFTSANDLTTLTNDASIKTVSPVGLSVANLMTVVTNAKVSGIQISDTATNVNNSLLTLKANINKIAGITNSVNPSGTRPNIVFTPTTYSIALADKLSGFSTVVDYDNVAHTNNSSLYSITTDANGLRTISRGGIRQTYSSNVNFFKFSDKNLFGTTGNKNVDAILLGGTKNWWYDTTAAATSDTQINGAMNALSTSSSKHALTYSFLTSSSIADASNSSSDSKDFAEMTNVQKAAVKGALDYISSLTNLTFTEANASGQGDINFGTNNQGSASAAYAYNPNTAPHINVMLNNAGVSQQTNASFNQGTYGWETLIHEIAHSLGLKHPGNYNAGGGGTVGPYLPVTDAGSRRYTIMSYKNPADGQNVTSASAGGGYTAYSLKALNPDTFMVYDIAALQFLYGVNTDGASSKQLRSAQTETATTVFKAMNAGETLTLAGLTFTAGGSGATAIQVANAFSGLSNNTAYSSLSAITNLTNGGTFTDGSFTGWSTGSNGGTATVLFTSATANTNVDDLSSSGTAAAPVITKSDGVKLATETASAVFKDMNDGEELTLAGLTFTAGSGGATKEQVANAFSGLSNNTAFGTLSAINDGTNGGTFTAGTFTGWSTGSNGGTETVLFTSATANTNVEDLSSDDPKAPVITITQGGAQASDFQTTAFTSGWAGFESLYVPSSQTSENLDLSEVANKNIIDLRSGAFSSINVLPPGTKNTLPTAMLQSAQTYSGMNNVAMAYGSQVNVVTGGAGKDTYFISDYDVTITDASATNKVYLNGLESDWTLSTSNGTTTYTNSVTNQTVTLVGNGFVVAYYDADTKALTHGALDLLA